ncbi:hypothetical protein ACSCB1_32270 [Streptomyces europaeiscabiei]|uniref:Transposase n=1 Tax=Streptomyces europaeiscabiei TaxID=146819 RepID=A0ABU4NMX1_9ACTN|nr:hypothetical protein [Streptomyces europaeiscabiei]MDX2528972.1 hypothetical protein [Streptomyces europaeiscabiei]MDX2759400.1 hypothetical protein [Streptomyces europaeiscabiei]MDX2769414.1 hypothetical protein [Streptomyces europaeiscabiei]MDX3546721.1 hypothetical protein [Streptomyces europaeiscabiei]MDX3556415.1 hypothetical protein [Streptomyces europaeiscabiei]
MSTHTVGKLVVRESGWAKSRRRSGERVRMCLPALTDGLGPRTAEAEADAHIVRGDD